MTEQPETPDAAMAREKLAAAVERETPDQRQAREKRGHVTEENR